MGVLDDDSGEIVRRIGNSRGCGSGCLDVESTGCAKTKLDEILLGNDESRLRNFSFGIEDELDEVEEMIVLGRGTNRDTKLAGSGGGEFSFVEEDVVNDGVGRHVTVLSDVDPPGRNIMPLERSVFLSFLFIVVIVGRSWWLAGWRIVVVIETSVGVAKGACSLNLIGSWTSQQVIGGGVHVHDGGGAEGTWTLDIVVDSLSARHLNSIGAVGIGHRTFQIDDVRGFVEIWRIEDSAEGLDATVFDATHRDANFNKRSFLNDIKIGLTDATTKEASNFVASASVERNVGTVESCARDGGAREAVLTGDTGPS